MATKLVYGYHITGVEDSNNWHLEYETEDDAVNAAIKDCLTKYTTEEMNQKPRFSICSVHKEVED